MNCSNNFKCAKSGEYIPLTSKCNGWFDCFDYLTCHTGPDADVSEVSESDQEIHVNNENVNFQENSSESSIDRSNSQSDQTDDSDSQSESCCNSVYELDETQWSHIDTLNSSYSYDDHIYDCMSSEDSSVQSD